MINELKKIVTLHGVTSDEGRVADYIKELITPYVDSVDTDPMGNLIAVKKSSAPDKKKIMLAAHMDEIGFMTTYIEDSGYIRVAPVGGINPVAYAYCAVVFANGTKGVIVPEGKVEAKDLNVSRMYVDIGVKNKKEAEKKVKIGDLLTVKHSFEHLYGKRYVGRPLDDRVGCYVMVEIAKLLKDCKNDVYFVFTTQEEVGLRGAAAASYNVSPDIGIAFDVAPVMDTIASPARTLKLGGGAAIKIKDSSAICNSAVVTALKELADANKIDSQLEITERGGTDTAMMQTVAGGSKAGAISIPSRYIHSQNEMIDMHDIECVIKLGALACDLRV